MTRKRARPTLGAPLGPQGRKALAERVKTINAAGDAARERLAAKPGPMTGKTAGRAPVKRAVDAAGGLDREIAQAEARMEGLLRQGAYAEADQAGRTLAGLQQRARRAKRAAQQARARRARLDHFALLVARSAVLTEWHADVADRWLAAMDAAADGLLARAADMDAEGGLPDVDGPQDGARDAVTGRRAKPDLDGAAIFLRGRSVLDRWKTAVPVAAVATGKRSVPATFDPKRIKTQRAAPDATLSERSYINRDKADRLELAFHAALSAGGHPAWCGAVAIRVIRHNEGLVASMTALGVPVWQDRKQEAQVAMAAGLCGVAQALGMAVDK